MRFFLLGGLAVVATILALRIRGVPTQTGERSVVGGPPLVVAKAAHWDRSLAARVLVVDHRGLRIGNAQSRNG